MVSLPVVLLIFISSSNDPPGNLKEGFPEMSTTMQPEKEFVDNGKNEKVLRPQVNDLTNIDFKFPDDYSKRRIVESRNIILENIIPHDKNEAKKSPIPLYSLVKNDCKEGYALDENGVCQKTITARKGKTLTADRRKRQIWDYDWLIQKNRRRRDLGQSLPYRKVSDVFVRDGFRKIPVECNKLYPGMVPDGAGGCLKLEDLPKSTS